MEVKFTFIMFRHLNAKVYSVHKWLGLLAGLILIVVGLTGSLIAFRDEVDDLQLPQLRRVALGPERVPLQTLVEAARAAGGARDLAGIYLSPEDPARSTTLYYEEGDHYGAYFFDPYTGRMLGEIEDSQLLSQVMLNLHYTLLARPWGDLAVALAGIAFLASGVTGVWVYRTNLLRPFQKGVRFAAGLRLLSKDLHTLVGLAALAFNVVLGISGVYMMLYAFTPAYLSGEEDRLAEARPKARLELPADLFVEKARAALPGLAVAGMSLPHHEGDTVYVYGNLPGTPFWFGGNSGGRSTVELDAKTAAVLSAVDINRADAVTRYEAVLYELHFGQFGGWPVKTLYAIGGLTPGLLSVTGFVLWWKRRRRVAVARTAPAPAGVPAQA